MVFTPSDDSRRSSGVKWRRTSSIALRRHFPHSRPLVYGNHARIATPHIYCLGLRLPPAPLCFVHNFRASSCGKAIRGRWSRVCPGRSSPACWRAFFGGGGVKGSPDPRNPVAWNGQSYHGRWAARVPVLVGVGVERLRGRRRGMLGLIFPRKTGLHAGLRMGPCGVSHHAQWGQTS